MRIELESESPSETIVLGRKVGKCLRGGEIVLLSGDLGTGKTLFTKGIAGSLGIDPDEIVSPSFVIMNQYEGEVVLFHFDLYRIGETSNKYFPEIDDCLDRGIIIVEWAQFLDSSYFNLPKAIAISFEYQNNDKRLILINTSLKYLELE